MADPEPGAVPMEGVEPAPVREQLAAAATARLAREAAQLRTCPFTDQPTDLDGFIMFYNGSHEAPPAEWHAAPVHDPSVVSSAANNPPPAATDDSVPLVGQHALPALTVCGMSVLFTLCLRLPGRSPCCAPHSRRCPTWRPLSLLHAHPCGGSLR